MYAKKPTKNRIHIPHWILNIYICICILYMYIGVLNSGTQACYVGAAV
jgi:hypothetical protein